MMQGSGKTALHNPVQKEHPIMIGGGFIHSIMWLFSIHDMTSIVTFDWSRGPSTSVVEAIAAERGVSPEDLRAPLYEYLDPDALDAIFAPRNGESNRHHGRIEFTALGCDVVVEGTGEITAERTSYRGLDANRTESERASD